VHGEGPPEHGGVVEHAIFQDHGDHPQIIGQLHPEHLELAVDHHAVVAVARREVDVGQLHRGLVVALAAPDHRLFGEAPRHRSEGAPVRRGRCGERRGIHGVDRTAPVQVAQRSRVVDVEGVPDAGGLQHERA
jgi:hypothetical protein